MKTHPGTDASSGSFIRAWKSGSGDKSIHVLGNGRICAYGSGPDLTSVFGPPYSGPQWGSITVAGGGMSCQSQREPGTAIWKHTLSDKSGELAVFTDFAASGTTSVVRKFHAQRPLHLRWQPGHNSTVVTNDSAVRLGTSGVSRALTVPRGLPFYSAYPFPEAGHASLTGLGSVTFGDSNGGIDINLSPGEGLLVLTGGPDLPTAILQREEILALGFDELLLRTRSTWKSFSAGVKPLPPAGRLNEKKLAWVLDNTAVQIKAQQGNSGGILAGHAYHMAYVRDQYGDFRGLLSMGLVSEAHAVLDYYWAVWQSQGAIHNAQPVGFHSPFHIHEEDRSEITGYLVLQACDWLEATGDESAIETIQPMIEWAIDRQLQVMVDGTLPFNGDETYVAGGMLPRSALSHASAEATLLFIEGGRRFADWAVRRNRWSSGRRDQVMGAVHCASTSFRRNFFSNGKLMADNPARAAGSPRFRHGVCERSMHGVGWLERDANGRYQCPECFSLGPLPKLDRKSVRIASVSLAPAFTGNGPLTDAEVASEISGVAESWVKNRQLPSQLSGNTGPAKTVGYDYGFLLMGLDRLGHPAADDLAAATLDLVDQTGAWVEYYLDGQPSGCRCRPWESAINLTAILNHLRKNISLRKKTNGDK